MGEDPIGFAGGDVNLSRYVGNGPTNWTDPSGLRAPTKQGELALARLENVRLQINDALAGNPNDIQLRALRDGIEAQLRGFWQRIRNDNSPASGGLLAAGVGCLTLTQADSLILPFADIAAIGIFSVACYKSATWRPTYIDSQIDVTTDNRLAELNTLLARKRDLKEIDRIVDSIGGMTRGQRRMLHDEITKQNYTKDDIKEIAEDIKAANPNK